ncbi:MAG: MBL fold metallo-hydrolase [Rhizobiaceae bacterium]
MQRQGGRAKIGDAGEPFELTASRVSDLDARIVRIVAPNAGLFTFHGTNSYLVGRQTLAVIDPGPDDERHLASLLAAIDGRPVTHIFITHTHRDHSPLARKLAAATGAICVGEGPHRYVGDVALRSGSVLDASADLDFLPDLRVGDGQSVECAEFAVTAIATPGHAQNHMSYALDDTKVLFSGDHVMGWATTIVAPPDGSMESYIASLETLAVRKDKVFLPGHGGPITKPQSHVRALKAHRLWREAAILERIRKGGRSLQDIVSEVYKATDPRLHGAAALTAMAHLQRLESLGAIAIEGPLGPDAIYTMAKP